MSRPFFERKTRQILRLLDRKDAVVGITFTDDEEMTDLNAIHRGKKKPTDVLSFPIEDRIFLGDVVISVDTARRQAAERKKPFRDEVIVLLIHGVLHLLGYDHVKDTDWKKMRAKEKKLYNAIHDL